MRSWAQAPRTTQLLLLRIHVLVLLLLRILILTPTYTYKVFRAQAPRITSCPGWARTLYRLGMLLLSWVNSRPPYSVRMLARMLILVLVPYLRVSWLRRTPRSRSYK